MNAHAITAAGIALAVTGAPRPTLGDFYAWSRKTGIRTAWEIGVKMAFGDFRPSDDLREFRKGVEARIDREERKASVKHWSYEPNRYAWMLALRDALDRFSDEASLMAGSE